VEGINKTISSEYLPFVLIDPENRLAALSVFFYLYILNILVDNL
jgi:hypothetical protein